MCRALAKFCLAPVANGRRVNAQSITAHDLGGSEVLRRLTLTALLIAACAACDGSGSAEPASSSSPPSVSLPSPSAATSSVPPELAGYDEAERAAYREAVVAYDRFSRRNDGFYARGETTPKAKEYYQRWAVDWSTAWANLAQVANNGVTVRGTTKTVWTRPKSIDLGGPDGDVVVLRRCLDEAGRVVEQDGTTVKQPQLEEPHVYTIRLERRPNEDRWRSGVAEQGRTC